MTAPTLPICERLQGFIDYVRTGKEDSLDAAVRRDEATNVAFGKGYRVPNEFEAMIDAEIARQEETPTAPAGVSEIYANPAASEAVLADDDFDVLAWLAGAIASNMWFASTGPTRILRDPYTHKPYVHFYVTRPVNMLAMTSNRLVSDDVTAATIEALVEALEGCEAYFEALEEIGDEKHPAMLKLIRGPLTLAREGAPHD